MGFLEICFGVLSLFYAYFHTKSFENLLREHRTKRIQDDCIYSNKNVLQWQKRRYSKLEWAEIYAGFNTFSDSRNSSSQLQNIL